MKTRSALLTAMLLTSVSAAQQPIPHPPISVTAAENVTGQMLVDMLRPSGRPASGPELYEALGYLRGVIDTTTVQWCRPRSLSHIEIDGEIVAYLAKLPPADRRGNALPQIAAALQKAFPCSARKDR